MISMRDYLANDATGLAQHIARREINAREVCDAAIERIAALNPTINAVVETLYDSIDMQIASLDPKAPFAGVPYLVKDLHTLVKGSTLSQGSAFLAGHISSQDSDLVARLRRAGFIIIGRSNTPEFGLNATTEPRLHGVTRNPWDLTRSPGGSSGGAAAAVASGMVPAAHATDSGGSTRIPAAACGLVGLKPSRGRNFAGLDRGEGWSDIFNAHAVTRSVRDSAAILDATVNISGPAPYYAPKPTNFAQAAVSKPPKMRIGIMRSPPSKMPVAQEHLGALDETALLCSQMGHELVNINIAIDGPRYAEAFSLILSSSVAATVAAHEAAENVLATSEAFEPIVWNAIQLARAHSAADLNRAIADLHLISASALRQMHTVDLLLSPTVAGSPPVLGALAADEADFDAFLAKIFSYAPFTSLWNGAGVPAISLPVAWDSQGLPIGVQFVAHAGREDLLFSLAGTLERELHWGREQHALLSTLS